MLFYLKHEQHKPKPQNFLLVGEATDCCHLLFVYAYAEIKLFLYSANGISTRSNTMRPYACLKHFFKNCSNIPFCLKALFPTTKHILYYTHLCTRCQGIL